MTINAETESVTYELNFKLGRRLKHALSTAMASYKDLVKLGGAYRVGRTRDGDTSISIINREKDIIIIT